MNTGLYLFLAWSLIPLAIIILAVIGQPVLLLPQHLFKSLSTEQVYTRSVALIALVSMGLLGYLTLQLALGTAGNTFPPVALRQFNLRTLYVLLFLFGAPLTVLGLVMRGRRFLAWPHHLSFGLLSEEGAYAIGVASVITLGAITETILAFRIALA